MKEHTNCRILAIETSCDETSAAVVENGTKILSNVISSQIDIHRRFGGVVPEVASRKHVETITRMIEEALVQANVNMEKISAVAVTQGPGLVGSLIVGLVCAKALAMAHRNSFNRRSSYRWTYLCKPPCRFLAISVSFTCRFRRAYGTCIYERGRAFYPYRTNP